MIKVFLAEDEFIIRESIKRTVNWNEQGYELVGEAGDGEKAYQMVLGCRPDILITDIRMPFMDGLELARLVRKKLPKTRIIIISGYDDFTYAKEAIRIGITEYMLKPVSEAKLLETLSRVREGIRADQEQLDYKAVYEAEHAERLKYERQNFYRNLIDGRLQMAEALDIAQDLNIRVLADDYCIVMLQIAGRENEETGSSYGAETVADAMQMIVDMTDRLPSIGYYEQLGGTLCLLVMANSAESLSDQIEQYLKMAAGAIAADRRLLMYASVGPVVERISEIVYSFKSASRKFARRFMYDSSKVFMASEENETDDPSEAQTDRCEKDDNGFSLSGFDIAKIDRPIIFHFLRSGTAEDVSAFVQNCFSGMSINNLNSELVRQYIVMDTYLKTASFLQGEGLNSEEIEKAIGRFDSPQEISTLQKTTAYLETMFAAALKERDRLSSNKYGGLIAQAKQYIYKNYAESDLSLGMTAAEVNVSPNHLSRLFSQSTGTTFIEFLTQVRMDKAKQLLLDTQLPGSEIAMQTGYADAHYFYYLFKKTQGVTPTQFRQEAERKQPERRQSRNENQK